MTESMAPHHRHHSRSISMRTITYFAIVYFVLTTTLPAQDRDVIRYRRIDVIESVGDGHGLTVLREGKDNNKSKVVFERGGANFDWNIKPQAGMWLIATNTTAPNKKLLYLSFVSERPKNSDESLLVLTEKPSDHSLWEFQFEGDPKNPARLSPLFGTATVSKGDFRGYYLSVGNPFEVTQDGRTTKYAAATLLKEKKVEKARLKLWQDGK